MREIKLALMFLVIVLVGCASEDATKLPPLKARTFAQCTYIDECVEAIQAAISANWARPKSAVNGMRVELVMGLDDKANVVSIFVEQSSGDSDFDGAAKSAILRASPFVELLGLGREEFRAHFSSFKLVFVPEDLER